MKKLLFSLLVLSSIAMVLPSCKGDKGDIGAAGTAGATGAVGTTGPAGPAGPAGSNGSLNVNYSSWSRVTYRYDSTRVIFGDTMDVYSGELAAPGITAPILTNGTVLAYFKIDGYTEVNPLSYNDGGLSILMIPSVGKIKLVSNVEAGTGFQYRYVFIPGGIAGGRLANGTSPYTTNELKAMPYKRIKALFDIKD